MQKQWRGERETEEQVVFHFFLIIIYFYSFLSFLGGALRERGEDMETLGDEWDWDAKFPRNQYKFENLSKELNSDSIHAVVYLTQTDTLVYPHVFPKQHWWI